MSQRASEPHRRWGTFLGAFLLAAGLPSSSALAGEAERCRDVSITVVGAPTAVAAADGLATMRGALGPKVSVEAEQASELSLEAVFNADEGQATCLRAVVDLRQPPTYTLLLIDDERRRYAVKRLLADGPDDPLLWEELGQTARSALDALARGEGLAQTSEEALLSLRESPPPPPPSPRRVDEPTDTGVVEVEAFVDYGLGFTSNGPRLSHGPRLGVILDFAAGRWRLGPMLDVAYELGPSMTDSPMSLSGRVDAIPIRLAAMGGVDLSPWRIGAWAGVGAALFIPMVSTTPPLEEVADLRVDALVSAGLRPEIAFGPDFGLFLDVMVTALPRRPRWVVTELTGNAAVFFSPWPVQPRLALGARVF